MSYGIVKDSSVWINPSDYSAVDKKNDSIRVGTVLKSKFIEEANETRYLVEVRDKNDKILMWCRPMFRFGGAHNYEDAVYSGFTDTPLSANSSTISGKAGDFVLVACLNGQGREGVIIGGLTHPARKSILKPDSGPAYTSEFNGVETKITEKGEYTLTYKGLPVNAALLKAPSTSAPIPPPVYNPTITGSYIKFDSTGSIEINDKAIALPQSIKIDKSAGSISIKAGPTELTMQKASQQVDLKCNILSINSKIQIKQETALFSVEAKTSIKLKAAKIAIGFGPIELIDQIIKLIDQIGLVVTQSPVGPNTPVSSSPNWTAIMLLKQNLTTIKGSL